MSITSISPFIALHADRSALLDVTARVLLLTVSRLTSRFEIDLPEVLRLLAGTDIRIRFDPVNGNPCIAFEDIPELLSAIRPRKNDRHNRKHLSMILEHAGLSMSMEREGLLYLPRTLSDALLTTLLPYPSWEIEDLREMTTFTQSLAVC
ncbi:hypothetical protein [Pseudomonas sp.]|uniref:hypothetical protein n=1 Tax=Pseudomonas sp. TaxID=306 RepID=UPI003BB791E4